MTKWAPQILLHPVPGLQVGSIQLLSTSFAFLHPWKAFENLTYIHLVYLCTQKQCSSRAVGSLWEVEWPSIVIIKAPLRCKCFVWKKTFWGNFDDQEVVLLAFCIIEIIMCTSSLSAICDWKCSQCTSYRMTTLTPSLNEKFKVHVATPLLYRTVQASEVHVPSLTHLV